MRAAQQVDGFRGVAEFIVGLAPLMANATPPTRTSGRMNSTSTGSAPTARAIAASYFSRCAGSWPIALGASLQHVDVLEAQFGDDATEECGFLPSGVHERETHVRHGDRQRDARQPAAGADVDDARELALLCGFDSREQGEEREGILNVPRPREGGVGDGREVEGLIGFEEQGQEPAQPFGVAGVQLDSLLGEASMELRRRDERIGWQGVSPGS